MPFCGNPSNFGGDLELLARNTETRAKLNEEILGYQPFLGRYQPNFIFFSQTSDLSAKLQYLSAKLQYLSAKLQYLSAKLQIFQPNHQPLTNPPSLPQIPNKNASHMQIIYIQKAFSYYNTLILSRSALSSTVFIYSIISSRISSRCKANSNVVFTNPNVSPTS